MSSKIRQVSAKVILWLMDFGCFAKHVRAGVIFFSKYHFVDIEFEVDGRKLVFCKLPN